MVTKESFSRHWFASDHGFSLPYRAVVPKGEGPFPLLLCLHGAGERGDDNEAQVDYFLPLLDSNSPALQAVTIIPQCPTNMRWVETDWERGSYLSQNAPKSPALLAVEELLTHLCTTLPIDPDRIYVTGLSMGGFATWRLLADHPDVFAAGLPLCGGGPLDKAEVLSHIPIHAFHCADDPIVPVSASRAIIEAVQAVAGNRTRYTEFPLGGHAVWVPVYDDSTNITWLFSQKK
jgi:predicted peptidase